MTTRTVDTCRGAHTGWLAVTPSPTLVEYSGPAAQEIVIGRGQKSRNGMLRWRDAGTWGKMGDCRMGSAGDRACDQAEKEQRTREGDARGLGPRQSRLHRDRRHV